MQFFNGIIYVMYNKQTNEKIEVSKDYLEAKKKKGFVVKKIIKYKYK